MTTSTLPQPQSSGGVESPAAEKPSTPLALAAGLPPLFALGAALAMATVLSGNGLDAMIKKAGGFGLATVGVAFLCTTAIGLGAFLCGRLVRIPVPVLAALSNVNPMDKTIILLAGWSETLPAAVLGFALAAGCCGGAAAALGLAAMARRSAVDRAYRFELLAAAAVLFGGVWLLLQQGLVAGRLAQHNEAVANIAPADRVTLWVAFGQELGSVQTLLLVSWAAAALLALLAVLLSRSMASRVLALMSTALVLGGTWLVATSIEGAQARTDNAATGSGSRLKLIRIEGAVTPTEAVLAISGLYGCLAPAQLNPR